MKVDFYCLTVGDGYWSDVSKSVQCIQLLADSNRWEEDPIEEEFGELRVQFNTSTWNVKQDGLIYTDGCFIKSLGEALRKLGFTEEAIRDISYSEQGMQGLDYVSFDIGHAFLKSYRLISGEPVEPDVA